MYLNLKILLENVLHFVVTLNYRNHGFFVTLINIPNEYIKMCISVFYMDINSNIILITKYLFFYTMM